MSQELPKTPGQRHAESVRRGARLDGRSLESTRRLAIEVDAIKTADASSLVKLGHTTVACGCTAKIVKIHDFHQAIEELRLEVVLPPISASPDGYRPKQNEHLLVRNLKNIFKSPHFIDRSSLHVKEEDSYWQIDIELVCINYDGSLLDAALVATISALRSLRLSRADSQIRLIKLNAFPVVSSFAVIGDRVIIDPNIEEETVAQSLFNITVDEMSGSCEMINKLGGKAIPAGTLFKCIETAEKRSKEVRQQIETTSGIKDDVKLMDCA